MDLYANDESPNIFYIIFEFLYIYIRYCYVYIEFQSYFFLYIKCYYPKHAYFDIFDLNTLSGWYYINYFIIIGFYYILRTKWFIRLLYN